MSPLSPDGTYEELDENQATANEKAAVLEMQRRLAEKRGEAPKKKRDPVSASRKNLKTRALHALDENAESSVF